MKNLKSNFNSLCRLYSTKPLLGSFNKFSPIHLELRQLLLDSPINKDTQTKIEIFIQEQGRVLINSAFSDLADKDLSDAFLTLKKLL